MDLENGLSMLKIEPMSIFSGESNENTEKKVDEVDIELDTLDEPVYHTIWRDLKAIFIKISLVLVPRPNNVSELKNWDLWGPLFFCLTLAM
jgi:protein YIPF6